jgi:hypothetical protein
MNAFEKLSAYNTVRNYNNKKSAIQWSVIGGVPKPLRRDCKDDDRHVLNDVLAREIGPDGGHGNGEHMVFEELGMLMMKDGGHNQQKGSLKAHKRTLCFSFRDLTTSSVRDHIRTSCSESAGCKMRDTTESTLCNDSWPQNAKRVHEPR